MFAVMELSRALSAPTTEHECKGSTFCALFLEPNTSRKNFDPHFRFRFPRNTRVFTSRSFSTATGPGVTKPAGRLPVVHFFVLGANILSHSRTHATVALSSGEAAVSLTRFSFVPWWKNRDSLQRRAILSTRTVALARASFRALALPARRNMCTFAFFTYLQESAVSGMVRMRRVLGTLRLIPVDFLAN